MTRLAQLGAIGLFAALSGVHALVLDSTTNRALYQSNTPASNNIVSSCHVDTGFANFLRNLHQNKHFEVTGFQWSMPLFEARPGLDAEKYREEFRQTCVVKYHGTYIYHYNHV